MDSRAKNRQLWMFVLMFIILRTFFALVWDVTIAGAAGECDTFAQFVYSYIGEDDPDNSRMSNARQHP